MKKLIAIGNEYIAQSDWKVIAVLKLCLISMGILIGVQIPRKHKKCVLTICLITFLVTYIPLMIKLLRLFLSALDDTNCGKVSAKRGYYKI